MLSGTKGTKCSVDYTVFGKLRDPGYYYSAAMFSDCPKTSYKNSDDDDDNDADGGGDNDNITTIVLFPDFRSHPIGEVVSPVLAVHYFILSPWGVSDIIP